MKPLSLEMACLLGIQNEIQAVWQHDVIKDKIYNSGSTCHLFAPGVCLEEKDIRYTISIIFLLKFSFSEKANLPYGFDVYKVNVKTMRQIAQIFVAFSEKLNFTIVKLV